MVDTDDTRRTTDVGRRTTDDGRRTTPRVWHKLPTGELKRLNETFFIKVPKHKQYSSILASNFEQVGQENTTSYNLQY